MNESRSPEEAAVCHARALELAEQHDYGSAITEVSRAIVLDPQEAAYWCDRGIMYNRLGRPEDALADHAAAAARAPDEPVYWSNMAVIQFQLGDLEGALGDWRHALTLDPDEALLQDIQASMAACERALHADAANRLSEEINALVDEGKHPTALLVLTNRIREEPEDPFVYLLRSWTYERLGVYEATLEDADRYLELAENPLAEGYRLRGVAHYRLGNTDGAVRALQQAEALDPESVAGFEAFLHGSPRKRRLRRAMIGAYSSFVVLMLVALPILADTVDSPGSPIRSIAAGLASVACLALAVGLFATSVAMKDELHERLARLPNPPEVVYNPAYMLVGFFAWFAFVVAGLILLFVLGIGGGEGAQ